MTNTQSGASTTWAILFVIVLLVGGAVYYMAGNDAGMMNQNQMTPAVSNNTGTMMGPVELVLSAQNNSGQNGKVTLSDENGQTKVVIEVTPGPKGVAQPAHIHSGDCTALGSIKYNLNDVVDGKSETILQPAMHFIHGLGQTAINIHKSKAEIGMYAGCGDLTKAFNNALHIGN
ncbi:MAG: hypothetical protein KW793_02790 [Candidatus Doudnabacteria bacterium]|nr:hypothetical protein [Candidatus Doudnabacteria bacterium]